MTLLETGASSGVVSLRRLFAGEALRTADPGLTVQDLSELITIGVWPAQQGRPVKEAARAARDYLEQVRRVDISRVGNRRRDPARVGAVLRALGRHTATEVRMVNLAVDAAGADGALDERTVDDYLQALERLMVIEDQTSWTPHLRSRARLRKAPEASFRRPIVGSGGPWHRAGARADSKYQFGSGLGCRSAIDSRDLMSCITAWMPSRID
ncbi:MULTISPECIES: DUF4143 domain-containing protein [unclassified Synechococcus]|uniref:DUF4143 domain-containing protein n=1 Tax=unclassified Synechococcus TaxID=2626047 RepID=UPI0021A2D244|nr:MULTISPECIES: hypothetical protein [unclassified Synechococcus]MCT0213478.1 hypothetical protein [Synechococcus sp. CS-1326]MCT0234635.1 hypothetical protein [Synechococcus sp. CS-1327]